MSSATELKTLGPPATCRCGAECIDGERVCPECVRAEEQETCVIPPLSPSWAVTPMRAASKPLDWRWCSECSGKKVKARENSSGMCAECKAKKKAEAAEGETAERKPSRITERDVNRLKQYESVIAETKRQNARFDVHRASNGSAYRTAVVGVKPEPGWVAVRRFTRRGGAACGVWWDEESLETVSNKIAAAVSERESGR